MVSNKDLVTLAFARIKYLGKLKLVTIDNWAFTLHYRLAAITLLLMSLFITCSQFFGKPISCIKNNEIKLAIIENYCWIEGTFTLPRALITDMELEAKGLPPLKAAPGIDHRHKGDHIVVHNYYYWVCIVLFLQGCCFLVTRTLWKVWEKGYMKLMMEDLNKAIASHDKRLKKSVAVTNFINTRNFDLATYSRHFIICEVLNLLNVIFQIYITDVFLKGQFLRYGWNMVFSKPKFVDPTNQVFPKLGKCTFRRFGASGDVQTYDNLCILPINIVNEKFYFVIWILFFTLLAVSAWEVFIRIMLILFKDLRFHYIQSYNKHISESYFKSVLSNSSYSFWFIIYLLSCNLEPMHFRDVILAMDYFQQKQTMPTELLGYELPLKKKLQNGYPLKRDSQKNEEKSNLVVEIPSIDEENEIQDVQTVTRDISNDTTLERN